MPELPEVETVVRHLRGPLAGRVIRRARIGWEPVLGGLSRARWRRRVAGARIESVGRRAKYILIRLSRNGAGAGWLVGHLRMTGRMHVHPAGVDPGPHARLSLELDDETVFHFIDVRKFGRLVWTPDPAAVLPRLGPEPLGPEFTPEWFRGALRRRRRALKPLLLDQSFLAGLGNIYADEALFLARLHPLRRSDRLRRPAADRLHAAIRSTLAAAVGHEGSTFDRFYLTPAGRPGSDQHEFRVYARTGRACRRCGASIRRIVVGQRGTHFCPRCQRAPPALSRVSSRP